MHAWIADLRLALRRLLQSPGFSLATVTMLALGIAISATMFGVLQGVFGSLPFPQAEQVVVVESHSAERGVANGGLTPAEAMRLSESDTPFAHFGYYAWGGMTVYQDERPREFTMVNVGAGFFPALGMPPLHGRWFNDDEFAKASDGVILSHAEWMRLFAGDPGAIGKPLETSAGRLQVIGVMPPAFATPSDSVGAWRAMPRDAYPLDQPWVWNARFVSAVARLDPGLAPSTVAQRLDTISAELADRYGLPAEQWQLRTRPLLEVIVGDLDGVLWSAFAVAMLVLLIACANVAILVDARQVARRHEQAVVQALGASRKQLYRSLLLEIALLTTLSVGLGVLLAGAGTEALRELGRSSLPRVDAIAIDLRALGFAALLGLLVPLVAALAGSLRPRGEASEAMRGGGRGLVSGVSRRRWLPLVGVALSTVSLVAGSALLFSLWQLQSVDPGVRHEHVYALQLFHGGGAERQRDFARRLQTQLQGLPGVDRVAVTSVAPLSHIGSFSTDVKLPERSEPEPFQLSLRRVGPGFGDLLQIPLLGGRDISADDRADSDKVAVINRELARRLFADGDPLNRVLELPLGNGPRVGYRVVGVSEDTRNDGLRSPPAPELWIPFEGDPSVGMTFLVSARVPLAGYEQLFTDALFAVDPREASTRIFRLSDEFDSQLASARFFARTVGGFALAALLLAAFGVYAVAALRQHQRIAQIGLRLAVGARPIALLRQMLRESLLPVLGGIALGTAAALAVLRMLQSQLFGVDDAQLSVVASGILVLLAAALLAALLPAWRASHTEPMSALRHE